MSRRFHRNGYGLLRSFAGVIIGATARTARKRSCSGGSPVLDWLRTLPSESMLTIAWPAAARRGPASSSRAERSARDGTRLGAALWFLRPQEVPHVDLHHPRRLDRPRDAPDQ